MRNISIGPTHHQLTVLARKGTDKNGWSLWLCRCSCGTEKILNSQCIGKVKSCGCAKLSRIQPKTGERFNMLTVIKYAGRLGKRKVIHYWFKCDCGRTKRIGVWVVVKSHVRSCGCLTGKCRIKKPKPNEYTCFTCRRVMPFTDKFFPVHAKRMYGLETVCRKCTCTRAKALNKRCRSKLRLAILTAYSQKNKPECCCCGEQRMEFLTLDHINGNGNKERKEIGGQNCLFASLRRKNFPLGYRTLCWNCNLSYAKYGYCPHQRNSTVINQNGHEILS